MIHFHVYIYLFIYLADAHIQSAFQKNFESLTINISTLVH